MSKVLVSILSDHVIPNYLFICEMRGQYQDLLFVTTQRMEEKRVGANMEQLLRREEGAVKRIVVENDDYAHALEALRQHEWRENDEYIVNLTGGTKIMSLAVHQFFSEKKSSFFYVPIGRNEYYDFQSQSMVPINYRVNLNEYFHLYGIYFEQCDELLKPREMTLNMFKQVVENGYEKTRKMRKAQLLPDNNDKRYYGGEWFEEYVYHRILMMYNLDDDEIALSLKLFRGDYSFHDNELDVAFVYNNELHVVECKVVSLQQGSLADVDKYLYKLAAVSKDFGLHPKTWLFTQADISGWTETARESLNKRMSILGISGMITGPDLIIESLTLK